MHDAGDTDGPYEKTIWEQIRERSRAERADGLDLLAGRLFGADRFVEAAAALEAAAELYIAEDRHLQAGKCLHNTAMALGIEGRPVDALVAHERAVAELASARSARAVYEALGDEDGMACLDSRRAEIMAAAGEPHEALALLEQVRAREQEAGRAPHVAWCDVRAARILIGLDDPNGAGPLLEAAAAVFEAVGADQWAAVARIDWASALLAAGEGGDKAARVLRRAQTPLRQAGMRWEARRCRHVQAAARADAARLPGKILRRQDAVA